jgi:hypothetical protein
MPSSVCSNILWARDGPKVETQPQFAVLSLFLAHLQPIAHGAESMKH